MLVDVVEWQQWTNFIFTHKFETFFELYFATNIAVNTKRSYQHHRKYYVDKRVAAALDRS